METEQIQKLTRRSSREIREAFKSRGCKVIVNDLGTSYRAGGEIFILAPELGEVHLGDLAEVDFIEAPFRGFDGTGYDGRGRHYTVWLVKPGRFSAATEAEFFQTPEGDRRSFGSEGRSGCGTRFFVDKTKTQAADFGAAFAALGI